MSIPWSGYSGCRLTKRTLRHIRMANPWPVCAATRSLRKHAYSNIWNFTTKNWKFSNKCHRRGKSTWPDRNLNPGPLAYRANTLANWATEPHGRPVTTFKQIRPRICSEPCRYRRDSRFAARSPNRDTHWVTKCHRGGKNTWPDRDSNPGRLAYRARTLANWATEPHGRPATYKKLLKTYIVGTR